MSKDVIYIEPENDITDIIDKVKTAKTKILALVPPKKSEVLASIVNLKLLARASRAADKSLVLVTNEPDLIKLAATAEIPVAKNLQSRPELPIVIKDNTVADKGDGTVDAEEANDLTKKIKPSEEKTSDAEAIEAVEDEDTATPVEDEDKETAASEETAASKKPKKKSLIPSLDRYRKWIIIGASGLVLVVGFLIWALIIAPAVQISIAIRTTGQNFSAPISFVANASEELLDEGIFALETAELSKAVTADFVATGEANNGERATGDLTLTRTAVSTSAIAIPKSTVFKFDGIDYVTAEAATLSAPKAGDCAAMGDDLKCSELKPTITTKVRVTASSAGETANQEPQTSGWTSTVVGFSTTSGAISGGTDKIVKIVTQKDIDDARALLSSTSESTGRAELLEKFPDSTFPIDGTFRVDAKEPVATPKVGEAVEAGITPRISAETVFTMYGVDRTKISQYIEKELSPTLPIGQKIYATGVSSDAEKNKARVENYKEDSGKITAKLTSYAVQIGPAVTEPEILDLVKGRKVGEVRALLKPLVGGNGTVDIKESVFWVSSVPDDPNKIEIIITIEE